MVSRNDEQADRTATAAAPGQRAFTAAQGTAAGIDAAAEDAHWREQHEKTSWHRPGRRYEDYQPAYELGWNRRAQSDTHFDAHENELADEWQARRGQSPLDWPEARAASQAAWSRADSVYYAQARQVGMDEAFAFIEPPDGVTADAASRPASGSNAAATLGDDEVVAVLNHLLENARDGEHGYHAFTQEVEAPDLKRLFDERAGQCRQAAQQLLPLIARYGGTPADGGTVFGALHRGWVHLKGALGGDGRESMLTECERAEDASVDRYRSALQHVLPGDVRAVLERQSVETRQQHERIEALRENARAQE